MKVMIGLFLFIERHAPSTDHGDTSPRFECEHVCRDPKDGELCLNRVKPGETLVEARSDSDVQIDRQIWV